MTDLLCIDCLTRWRGKWPKTAAEVPYCRRCRSHRSVPVSVAARFGFSDCVSIRPPPREGQSLFYLGTHQAHWLEITDVPLFVARSRLANRRRLPRARGMWALDSGGFTQLSMHGSWDLVPAKQYATEVRRFRDEVGMLIWAAIQDWMCEPWILAKTGLSLLQHQLRTIDSYKELLDLAPDLPWTPVLQGWEERDYLNHRDMYGRAGIDLTALPLVGLGSVCRRQATDEAAQIVGRLHYDGLRLHGFGFKTRGLTKVAHLLESSDSLAWSFAARREAPLPGHDHLNCANCLEYALAWRLRLLRAMALAN